MALVIAGERSGVGRSRLPYCRLYAGSLEGFNHSKLDLITLTPCFIFRLQGVLVAI